MILLWFNWSFFENHILYDKWPSIKRLSCVLLTCSISSRSACSKVVRLWRSFIASRSSASLRSSIRRSAASSRLTKQSEKVRLWKVIRAHLNAATRRWWKINSVLSSRPEWLNGLLSFASTSRRKVQHLYGWTDTHKMGNVEWPL